MTKASQIDFILTRKVHRGKVTNSKAMPNIVIDIDHRPVMVETRAKRRPKAKMSQGLMTTNLEKLQQDSVKAAIKHEKEGSVQEEWAWFKDCLTQSLETNCGTRSTGRGKIKGTAWWNDKVHAATKEKKKLFKKWIKSNLEVDYNEYKVARKSANIL